MFIYICTYMYKFMYTYIYIYVYICVSMCIQIYVSYTCWLPCTCTAMYTAFRVYMLQPIQICDVHHSNLLYDSRSRRSSTCIQLWNVSSTRRCVSTGHLPYTMSKRILHTLKRAMSVKEAKEPFCSYLKQLFIFYKGDCQTCADTRGKCCLHGKCTHTHTQRLTHAHFLSLTHCVVYKEETHTVTQKTHMHTKEARDFAYQGVRVLLIFI